MHTPNDNFGDLGFDDLSEEAQEEALLNGLDLERHTLFDDGPEDVDGFVESLEDEIDAELLRMELEEEGVYDND